MTSFDCLRDEFLGEWMLTRQITDRRAGQAGHFSGTARFTPLAESAAIYDETGLLRLGAAAPVRAERRYLYEFGGGRITVRFADGRDFVNFDARSGAAALHHCDPDLYRVTHDFSRWPQWQAIWTVSGPRKDYTMQTLWHRPLEGGAGPISAAFQ